MNQSDNLEKLIAAGATSFKIEGRLKDISYVKNVTAYYRQKLDEIFERRAEYMQSSCRDTARHVSTFEINPEKSFNRGFTDFFINGRQKGIDSPFTPKSMGEYIGEVAWCNPLRMEIATDKTLHNGDGLCFLNENDELVGLRADVVTLGRDGVHTVSTNRPHGAHRGAKIYRNYDIEWQKQVEASTGNRKIAIDLVLAETGTGYEMVAVCRDAINRVSTSVTSEKITANNPDKATENIRKKALQWGDTPFNPINLELRFAEPRLIPASVIGEMKRQLVEKLTDALIVDHQTHRDMRQPSKIGASSLSTLNSPLSTDSQLSTLNSQLSTDPDAIPEHLMTCHHCIRFANGMCLKQSAVETRHGTSLQIRHGDHTFRLEFDCRHCLMYVCPLEND